MLCIERSAECTASNIKKTILKSKDSWMLQGRLLHSQDDVSSSDDDIDLSSLCLLLIALAELSNENVEQHHHHNEQEQPVDQDSQPAVGKIIF